MTGTNREVVIAACGRSAVAKAYKGALHATHPVELGGQILRGVLDKLPQLSPDAIDDVIIGCARPEGPQCSNIGRLIALRAGIPASVPAQTLTRFCSSGLQAVATGANAILSGQQEVVVCGGVESMTCVTMGTPEEYRCQWLSQNYPDAYIPMGLTAENVARKYNISRREMEEFAVESHRKAARAQAEGRFDSQIIPVIVPGPDGEPVEFKQDEGIRPNSTVETLQKPKPAFLEAGLVTAAPASQMSDGAGMAVLMSAEKAEALGISPVAKFIAHAVVGVEPAYMGLGPIGAVRKLLSMTGGTVDDFDVIEINEAFAAQAIPCIRELGFDMAKVNPNGGAIALGHPLGGTGLILLCKALAELQRTGGTRALVTMCIGGGMGAAAAFELL